jgi:hypothetical protein
METTTSVDTAPHPLASVIPPLKIADRCDNGRCSAQAFVVVQLTVDDGSRLQFCGHHFHKHEDALRARDPFAILDDRHKINARPTAGDEPPGDLG